MLIHSVTSVAGSVGPVKKRVGRGIGSHGKTSGRGHKGESSRSGAKGYLVKEGGQMPMFRKVAKRGFNGCADSFLKKIAIVNLKQIMKLGHEVQVVSVETLIEHGIVPRRSSIVRLLGVGSIVRPMRFIVSHVSRSAMDKVSAAGGTIEIV